MCAVSKTPGVRVYIGLGSNVGDRVRFMREAIHKLEHLEGFTVLKASHFYETDPIGMKDQGKFLNAVVEGEVKLAPYLLLWSIEEIEKQIGRQDRGKWGPREIDLDLLFYGNTVHEGDDLTLPHARLHERDFVLVPLAELNEELVHPKLNKSIKTLLEESKAFDGSHPKPYPVETTGGTI